MTTRHEFTTEVTNEKEVAKGRDAYRHVHCTCGWSEGGYMGEEHAKRDWDSHVEMATAKEEQARIAAGMPARLEAAEARLVACETRNGAMLMTLLAALRETITPLILLGDYIGNEWEGKTGIPAFDRCAIIGRVRAAIATGERA
jgi:hypothetical protein